MARKIIQISAVSFADSEGQGPSELFALADDGTVWRTYPDSNYPTIKDKWFQITPLPDESPKFCWEDEAAGSQA